jgi:hypothetical protein
MVATPPLTTEPPPPHFSSPMTPGQVPGESLVKLDLSRPCYANPTASVSTNTESVSATNIVPRSSQSALVKPDPNHDFSNSIQIAISVQIL